MVVIRDVIEDGGGQAEAEAGHHQDVVEDHEEAAPDPALVHAPVIVISHGTNQTQTSPHQPPGQRTNQPREAASPGLSPPGSLKYNI